MGQPARMRRHHIVDIPRFSRIRHRCEDSPESENLARTCPDARYSEKSLNISRQKGESESFSESNLNISPNRRGRCGRRRAGMPSPAQPVRKRKRPGTCFRPAMRGTGTRPAHRIHRAHHTRSGVARLCETAQPHALAQSALPATERLKSATVVEPHALAQGKPPAASLHFLDAHD